jgi:hypothetical protein
MPEVIARPAVTLEMIAAAAEIVAAKIDGDASEIAACYHHPMDGFELAKKLDAEMGWDTDRNDMDALDEVEILVSRALADAESKWLEASDIKPPLPIGSMLRCYGNQVGTITGIYKYSAAAYEVKPDGQDDATSGNKRWIIKFEDAVAA